MDDSKLTMMRPKQAGYQSRYILLGEIEGMDGRVLLVDVDYGTVNTHFRIDDLEPVKSTRISRLATWNL